MIAGLRKYAYMLSALAVACFFLFPDPHAAVIGALLLQTLAFVIIAGKSAADGIVLTGITLILIGLLPADHPLIRGAYFGEIRPWFMLAGILVALTGIAIVMLQTRRHK